MGVFSRSKGLPWKEASLLILSFLLLAMLPISPFIIFPVANSICLARFSFQLEASKLPPDTRLLDHDNVCGKLNGNGNGMDFLAVLLVSSDLPQEELQHYYGEYGFQPAKGKGEDLVNVVVLKAKTTEVSSDLLAHREISFQRHKDQIVKGNCYYVILYDGGYDAPFDVRGH